ncbi:MAG: hypothetical protein NTZ95_03700 [Candidatus Omnitrophica bacterium]|nr:hypothetical protein [Candidatus Omnitrophota bacterium]
MSKKIVYWTGFLEPDKEAVSKEVFELRRHFDGSFVFGMSKYYLMKHSFKERYFGGAFTLS